jgi:hypothetical protein
MAQSYFDFHFHPVFKQFITAFEETYPTKRPAQEIIKEMDLTNVILDIANEIFIHIIESQCCIDQTNRGGIRLGIANIVSIEHGIADSTGPFASILKSGLTRPVDQHYMRSVQLGELSYFRLFIKELDLYRRLSDKANGTPYLEVLTRRNPVDIKEDKFYVALGMEGGHNLSRLKIAKPGIYDIQPPAGSPDPGAVYNDFCAAPCNAVNSLKRLHNALWKENMDLFYITLTHLSHIAEQPLATHAFGMKMLKHASFYPVGNGITPLGKEVIDAAYTMTAKNDADEIIKTPVLIDIKHMALKSRMDLYEYRKANPAYEQLPVVASHVGVTGYSVHEWIDALQEFSLYSNGGIRAVEIMTQRKKAGEWGSLLNNEFTYNPWSINLMDDDIIEVLRSGGLIGVSLDIRILGFQAKIGVSSKEESEFLSTESFKNFFPHKSLKGVTTAPLESMEMIESWLLPTKEERHPLCLCFNILHIVSVALNNKSEIGKKMDDPWKHISIGTDFDGLIDPIKICKDSSKMPELEKVILKWLPAAADAYKKENGGPVLLPVKDGDYDIDLIREMVRGIMYENGKAFLQKWVKSEFS